MQNSISIIVLLSIVVGLASANLRYYQENEIETDYNVNAHRLPLGRCVSGYDCDTRTQCSVMGMQRFSEPRCEALGSLGSPCRMYSEPENKTLNFPHVTQTCEEVYMQFCPCGAGLICHEAECKRSSDVMINNNNNNNHQSSRPIQQQSSKPRPSKIRAFRWQMFP